MKKQDLLGRSKIWLKILVCDTFQSWYLNASFCFLNFHCWALLFRDRSVASPVSPRFRNFSQLWNLWGLLLLTVHGQGLNLRVLHNQVICSTTRAQTLIPPSINLDKVIDVDDTVSLSPSSLATGFSSWSRSSQSFLGSELTVHCFVGCKEKSGAEVRVMKYLPVEHF